MTFTKKPPSAYQQKLLDPRWQKKRLEIMERASFKCEVCGDAAKTQHIHHGYYDRGLDPWEHENETLYCLCEDCHEAAQSQLTANHRMLAIIGPDTPSQWGWIAAALLQDAAWIKVHGDRLQGAGTFGSIIARLATRLIPSQVAALTVFLQEKIATIDYMDPACLKRSQGATKNGLRDPD